MPPGNEPQIVEEAKFRPGKCLASGDTEGPFIDAGRWTREHDPYVQLSVRWVEEQARNLLGMVSRAEVDERYAKLEAEVQEYAEKLMALQRLANAATEFSEAVGDVAEQSVDPDLPVHIDRMAGPGEVPA